MSQLAPANPIIVNRPPRPLLARVAESAFWMARYVERAEHAARILLVNTNSMLDVGDIDPDVQSAFLAGPLRVFLLDLAPESQQALAAPRDTLPARLAHYLTLDRNNPSSMLSCITRARENARSIRETISAEMWEALNTLYWSLRGDDVTQRFEEASTDLFRTVMNGSLLFQGLSDQTLGHGQVWQFIQLGKFLERTDLTCRIIETYYEILRQVGRRLENAERNAHLLSVVRMCCSLEAFRRRSGGEIDADRIAAFLLLERRFPRSVAFCASRAHDATAAISADTKPTSADPAEGILGRLEADLRYTQPAEISGSLLAPSLHRIQTATLDAALAVKQRYFLQ